ncbi:hypothetical protein [Erythrobacter rubeus]|uniref:Uncharacterized protein n=1 Tax=Erythrobacter rubeus TaxID=2760803 RepID=A0ABR8KPU1_9SPHN|nr:hypothetical protein [Erythrobacter rubeus]MBD2841023.1 hypothetical protein [Erythrobacter rubeus]
MSEETGNQYSHCLATLEEALREAEKAFVDADTRYLEAQRDRKIAMEAINQHQIEIDAAVAELRKISIPGTRWHLTRTDEDDTLELNAEDMVPASSRAKASKPDLVSSEAEAALAKKFDRLRSHSAARSDDPVLKVVAKPGR